MKPNVVLYKKIPADQLERLQSHFNVAFFEGITDANRADFIGALSNAEGLIGASCPITADYLNAAPALRAISTILSLIHI